MKEKKAKAKPGYIERVEQYPTNERILKGGINIHAGVIQVEDPLRIDKLLRNAIIDELQHLYGLQIITLWTIACRPFIKAVRYDKSDSRMPDFEHIAITRMSAEDQFYKTMSLLSDRDRKLISMICFEEMGAIAAGRKLALPVNSITIYVRAAFDALGEALAKMRDHKKSLEKDTRDNAVEL